MATYDDYSDDRLARADDVLDFDFSVKKKRELVLSFRVGGRTGDGEKDLHTYRFTVPKTSVMALPMFGEQKQDTMLQLQMSKATFDWISAGLSKEDNDRLVARLRDPRDDFDVEDLTAIGESLIERATERPTT